MPKLKLGIIDDDKPVKISIDLPAPVHRDLVTYAEVLARETGRPPIDPGKLVAHMIERFMATDRGFANARRASRANRASSTPG